MIMASRIKLAATAAITIAAISAAANASPLVVDFQELAGETFTGQAYYTGDGVADGSVVWNPITPSTGAGSGALTSNGTTLVTPISFNSDTPNTPPTPPTPGSGAPFYQPTGNPNYPYTLNSYDPQILLGQGAYGYHTFDFGLTSVPQGTYDLYLYSSVGYYAGSPNEVTDFAVSNSTPLTATYSIESTDVSFVPASATAGSFVEFQVTVGSNGTISGDYTPGPGGQVEFNGLQLVQVPEPASLGILAAGSLGMLARRRRCNIA